MLARSISASHSFPMYRSVYQGRAVCLWGPLPPNLVSARSRIRNQALSGSLLINRSIGLKAKVAVMTPPDVACASRPARQLHPLGAFQPAPPLKVLSQVPIWRRGLHAISRQVSKRAGHPCASHVSPEGGGSRLSNAGNSQVRGVKKKTGKTAGDRAEEIRTGPWELRAICVLQVLKRRERRREEGDEGEDEEEGRKKKRREK